jgi:drug/metabolite transporter (DMT)-like permease
MLGDSMTGISLALAALVMFSANILLTKLAMARADSDLGFTISVSVNVLFGAAASAAVVLLRHGGFEWDAAAVAIFLLSGAFTTYLGRWFLRAVSGECRRDRISSRIGAAAA